MHYIITIVLIFVFKSAVGQQVSAGKPHTPSREEEFRDSANRHCVRHNRYSLVNRLNNYPFSNASSIRIASFRRNKNLGATLPMKGNDVDISGLFENVVLEKSDVDTLTSILYNVGYKGEFYSVYKGCYNPRNAILFLDATGRVFSYIELCFECHEFKVSSDQIIPGDFCIDKYQMLASFFSTRKVYYGTLYSD